MRRLPLLFLLLAACARPAPSELLYRSAGADRADAPAPGEKLELGLRSIDGERVRVPDPEGRYAVVELIRSADW